MPILVYASALSFLLALSNSWIFRFIASLSSHTILNSFCSLLKVPAESRRFYCAPLISSVKLLFSPINFWMRCLYVSDSWLKRVLRSFNSTPSLESWAEESLSPYWCSCTSPPSERISLFFFSTTWFNRWHYSVSMPILFSASPLSFLLAFYSYWIFLFIASPSSQTILN
jgi:hypothetical protein